MDEPILNSFLFFKFFKKNKKEYDNLPMDDDEKQNNLEIKGHSLWRFLLKKFEK